jgi:hypothetical protein
MPPFPFTSAALLRAPWLGRHKVEEFRDREPLRTDN